MSALTDTRQALATLLDGAITDTKAFSEFPEKVTPPFVAVGPGDPYVDFEGATFGGRNVRLIATFVTERGTNEVRAADLDEAIVTLVEKIEDDGSFMVTRVDQPGQLAINGQAHLGVPIHVLTQIEF